jgi:hypothetical protein
MCHSEDDDSFWGRCVEQVVRKAAHEHSPQFGVHWRTGLRCLLRDLSGGTNRRQHGLPEAGIQCLVGVDRLEQLRASFRMEFEDHGQLPDARMRLSKYLGGRDSNDRPRAQLSQPARALRMPRFLRSVDRPSLRFGVETGEQKLRESSAIGRRQREKLYFRAVG